MKKSTTRRALLLSFASMFLCFTMLLGTTYAWFTDSVESGVNQIVAGNLDVELEYIGADGKYAPVTDTTEDLFISPDGQTKGLWEPGHTEIAYLKVTNVGDLALKYSLQVTPVGEVVGKNADGKDIKLSEILEFVAVDFNEGDALLTREEALAKIAAVDEDECVALTDFSKADKILEKDASHYVALIVNMPTSVGDEANYRGDDAPEIDFRVSLYATQVEAEFDSFGDDYDALAPVEPELNASNGGYQIGTADELLWIAEQINNGVTTHSTNGDFDFVLINDIDLAGIDWTPIVKYTDTFDGQGYKIKNLTVDGVECVGFFAEISGATIKNVTFDGANITGNHFVGVLFGWEGAESIYSNVENCHVTNSTITVSTINGDDGDKVGSIGGYAVTTNIKDCTATDVVISAYRDAGGILGYANGKLTVSGCSTTGIEFLWNNAVNYKNYTTESEADLGAIVGEAANDASINDNTGGEVEISKVVYINTAEDLLAIAGKSLEGIVIFNNDIDLTGENLATIGAAYGKNLEVIGNGYTISNANLSHTPHNGMKHYGMFYAYTNSTLTVSDLVIENINIDSTSDTERNYGSAVLVAFADGGSTVNVNNVDIHNCTVLNNVADIGDEAAVYVGYQTGTLTMTDCDSTGCSVEGETAEKTGAFIGMVNGTATLTNCTTDIAIGACNRITDTSKFKVINCFFPVLAIDTLEELTAFAEAVNAGTSYKNEGVALVADIDLAGEEWSPIGNSTNSFQGHFNGFGHTISNLVITGNKSDVGLFGMTTNGSIKNLTVENAKVSGRLNVGVVAGTPYTSKYENITVTGHVEVNGMSYVGGVGGKNAYANWTNVTVNVDDTSYVKANSIENNKAYRTYVGGVVGFMGEGGHAFTNVNSNIDVIGSTCDVGGIVGIAHYGNSFINCSSSGNVTITDATEAADAEEMGGIAGVWHNGGSDVTFDGCSFTGTLTANITEGVDLSDNTITGKAYSATGTGNLIIK